MTSNIKGKMKGGESIVGPIPASDSADEQDRVLGVGRRQVTVDVVCTCAGSVRVQYNENVRMRPIRTFST